MTIPRVLVALAALTAAGAPALRAQADLRGIGGSGPTDIWVVGDKPAAVHFDGQNWTEMPFGVAPGGDLNAVWAGGPRDVFAVGDNGTILHYDGAAWTKMNAPTDRELVAVGGRSARDVYALAQSRSDREPPVLLHYDGSAWTAAPLALPFRAGAMVVTSAEVVVAGFVYRDPTPQQRRQVGVVARLRGGSWTISGWNGQSVTDPTAGGAGWTSLSAGGSALLLFGTRDDGTAALALSTGGAWQMLPPATSAMSSTRIEHGFLVGDATPVVLYNGPGFARYTGGAWAAVAPAANMMQQMMQMQMQPMPSQQMTPQQMQQMQQQQQMMANPMMMALRMAAFDMTNARSAWGVSANDFYVATSDGHVSHVTGGEAMFVYDASCADPIQAGMNPMCQLIQQQRQMQQGPPR